MEKRTIVIGDIHGCLSPLKLLLNKINVTPKDRIISCGDIFDRGPKSIEVLKFLRDINAEIIIGNHEDKYLRYYNHSLRVLKEPDYINPINLSEEKMKIYGRLKPEELEYLDALPRVISLNDRIKVIHAGAQANMPFDKQPQGNFMYLRYLKESGGAHGGHIKDGEKKIFWAEKWQGPECIVYGHYVHNLTFPIIHANSNAWCLGLDTGACFGGMLSSVVFTERNLENYEIGEIVQVPGEDWAKWRN